jgi:hypothetical protein
MSNTGKFVDPIPGIPTAGCTTTIKNESTLNCMKPDEFLLKDTPGTPEHIKKYRKSFQNRPGVKQVHPGLVGDNDRQLGHLYGRPSGDSEHVTEVINA